VIVRVHHISNNRRRSDTSLLESDTKARAIITSMNDRYYARKRTNHMTLCVLAILFYWTLSIDNTTNHDSNSSNSSNGNGSDDMSTSDSGHPLVVILACLCMIAMVIITMYHDVNVPDAAAAATATSPAATAGHGPTAAPATKQPKSKKLKK
jgi:hypothetical protein